jgi:hypothetical protein
MLTSQLISTDDYEIFEDERRIGRVFKLTFPTSERWYWRLYKEGGQDKREGTANSMVEAGLAFRNALDARHSAMTHTVTGDHFTLRPIGWPDGHSDPDDYNIVHDGDTVVGRIYRMSSVGRELWRWTQIGPRAPTRSRNGGVADTLDEAMTAFCRAWEVPTQ